QSTLARFATARALLPAQQTLFAEAADTLRVVLWQQGRIGISQGTSAIDLPPALLSRHDRHVLKSGFRSILRLLQFTANPSWITTLGATPFSNGIAPGWPPASRRRRRSTAPGSSSSTRRPPASTRAPTGW